jgi:predicted MFS family arabinose efflux permease
MEESQKSHFLEIFSPSVLRVTVLTSLLAIGVQGGYYAITTWLPTFLKTERKLSVLNTGGYLIVVIVGSFVGYMISAYLADAPGRKWTLVIYAICSFMTLTAYTYLPSATLSCWCWDSRWASLPLVRLAPSAHYSPRS